MTRTYHSEAPLKKGQAVDLLRIPVCEGEATKADRNRRIGELVISGAKIPRDLPAHSEVEVTLEMDASRLLTVRAYVPVLDVDFEAKLTLKMMARTVTELVGDVEQQFARLDTTLMLAREVADGGACDELSALKDSELARELHVLTSAAQDADAAVKCESRLLEFKRGIDAIADKLEWPKLLNEAKDLAANLREQASSVPDASLKKQADLTLAELARAIDARNIADVRVKMSQAWRLYWQVLATQPAFWVYQFQQVEKDASSIPDKGRAAKLCDQGRAFMSQNNADGLRNVVTELWNLMPSDVAERNRQGYQGGLVKGAG